MPLILFLTADFSRVLSGSVIIKDDEQLAHPAWKGVSGDTISGDELLGGGQGVLAHCLNKGKRVEPSVALFPDIKRWPGLIRCNVGCPKGILLTETVSQDLK
jgi:hypothetical protein